MTSVRLSVLVALLGVLAACSTAPLRQAEGIAVSGKAYAQAVRGVGDLALTESLDYTVDRVAFERDRATDREKRKANLERANTMFKRRIELVATANLQIALVEEYFVALEARDALELAEFEQLVREQEQALPELAQRTKRLAADLQGAHDAVAAVNIAAAGLELFADVVRLFARV